MWQAPLWEFELTYDALAGDAVHYPGAGTNSLQTLMGFYLLAGGQQSSFLYIDPDFNTLFGQALGVGDGATTKFPLMRTVGGFVEPVSWSTGVGAVYLNGVTASGWSVIAPATVVFAVPPASGALVSADFTYGFVCRFIDDTERLRGVHAEPLAGEGNQVSSGALVKAASAALQSYLAAAQLSDAPLTMADCLPDHPRHRHDDAASPTIDRDVVFGGATYQANAVLIDGLKYKSAIGLEVDKQQLTIAAWPTQTINGAPVLQALAGGAFDGARVQRWRVFLDPSLPGGADGVLLFQGRVSTVDSVGRTQAKLTVASDLVVLEYDMPHNLFSPTCSHVLYDQGCTRQPQRLRLHRRGRRRIEPDADRLGRRASRDVAGSAGHADRPRRWNSDHDPQRQSRRVAGAALSAALSRRDRRRLRRLLRLRPHASRPARPSSTTSQHFRGFPSCRRSS